MGKEQYSEDRLSKLSYSKFLRLFGVGRVIFDAMIKCVNDAINKMHLSEKGRKPKYGSREMVIIFFVYKTI